MSRNITVAAAQLGPIQMAEPRSVAVERMAIALAAKNIDGTHGE